MSIDDDTDESCPVCKRGRLALHNEEISFHQWTDKGYVFCHAAVPVKVCKGCGFKSWDDAAEAAIEEAVRREYDKLS
jgi:C4-type Zn-finger protein